MQKLVFIISAENINTRLDIFVFQQLKKEFSRSYLQKLIKAGKILVNDKLVKPSYKLKIHDKIQANIIPPEKISLEADASIKLDIIYEDNNVIVINKPAGLVVHPSQTTKNKTLVNALLAYYPPIKDVGEDLLRPGIVHRLDKETSGLIIVAKDNETFQFLKKQFKEREVVKKYLALIDSYPEKEKGIIEGSIERSKNIPTKQKISESATAKKASTEYQIIKRVNSRYCLVEAMPKTGRMHQIRVHFAHIGHPIAGDAKYGGPNIKGLTRHFLHATYLKIKIPSPAHSQQYIEKEFNIELPPELQNIISELASQ